MKNKYNQNFERDFNWYLSIRHIFNFDGQKDYYNKYGEDIIIYDKKGIDGKKAFFEYDSNGRISPTKHPNLLHTLLKVKGSTNLHIKMYAEDRANGLLPLNELDIICKDLKSPSWFKEAIENLKIKIRI